MARKAMVVNVTAGALGFTVSDASREWELAVFISPSQGAYIGFVVVLTMVDGVCYSTQRLAQPKLLTTKVVNAVGWMCKSWVPADREVIKTTVRDFLEK